MFPSSGEAIIHSVTVIVSVLVLGISVQAYRSIGGRRYLLLVFGFLFMAFSQVEQFLESYFLSSPAYLPFLDVHLSHLLDLVMLVFFGAALLVR